MQPLTPLHFPHPAGEGIYHGLQLYRTDCGRFWVQKTEATDEDFPGRWYIGPVGSSAGSAHPWATWLAARDLSRPHYPTRRAALADLYDALSHAGLLHASTP